MFIVTFNNRGIFIRKLMSYYVISTEIDKTLYLYYDLSYSGNLKASITTTVIYQKQSEINKTIKEIYSKNFSKDKYSYPEYSHLGPCYTYKLLNNYNFIDIFKNLTHEQKLHSKIKYEKFDNLGNFTNFSIIKN